MYLSRKEEGVYPESYGGGGGFVPTVYMNLSMKEKGVYPESYGTVHIIWGGGGDLIHEFEDEREGRE